MALLSINRKDFDDEASSKSFFEYVLFESKMLSSDLKRLVVLPLDQIGAKEGKQSI